MVACCPTQTRHQRRHRRQPCPWWTAWAAVLPRSPACPTCRGWPSTRHARWAWAAWLATLAVRTCTWQPATTPAATPATGTQPSTQASKTQGSVSDQRGGWAWHGVGRKSENDQRTSPPDRPHARSRSPCNRQSQRRHRTCCACSPTQRPPSRIRLSPAPGRCSPTTRRQTWRAMRVSPCCEHRHTRPDPAAWCITYKPKRLLFARSMASLGVRNVWKRHTSVSHMYRHSPTPAPTPTLTHTHTATATPYSHTYLHHKHRAEDLLLHQAGRGLQASD